MQLKGINYECAIKKEGHYLYYLSIITDKQIRTLQRIIDVFSNSEILHIYSYQGITSKLFKIIIYGYFDESFSLNNKTVADIETEYQKKLSSFTLNQSDKDVTFRLYKNFIIKDIEYPITQFHNPVRSGSLPKTATIISGDWFNRILNDLAYVLTNRDNRIGEAIGNAGMYVGMKIAQDINVFYNLDKLYEFMAKNNIDYSLDRLKELIDEGLIEQTMKQDNELKKLINVLGNAYQVTETEQISDLITGKRNFGQIINSNNSSLDIEHNFPLKIILTKILKAYGYAEIDEHQIKNIKYDDKIIGYKFVVNSHVFLYDDKADKREFIVKRANGPRGFNKRNCFFFRDMLKGIIEYLNEEIDEKTFIPIEAKYMAMEYELHQNGTNLFDSENIEPLINNFPVLKNTSNRVDTCSYIASEKKDQVTIKKHPCKFYIFKKYYLLGD